MFPNFDKVASNDPQPSGSTSANTCINAMLGEVRTYCVEYSYLGQKHHCQIGATSVEQCKQIFAMNFNCCFIEKIQTIEDIADEISDRLIAVVKEQLKSHFT